MKLSKEQADLVWEKFEEIADRMIKQNNAIDVGEYQSGFEDAVVELRKDFETLLANLE